MNASILKAEGLGKQYRLYTSPGERLKALLGWPDRSQSHWALNDVSFELTRGQCLGVVGDNGAGKSTLLKLLAGTLQPSHGQLHRVGRLTAILELGAGFHPDFTGRENLVFGGSLIGLDAADMQRLQDSIIDFSELGMAIERPVKTYSSGMVVRLAFALITAVQPEVLIIDEALAVGDQHFQKKCVQRIESFRKNGCTVLFCSHSLYHVRQLCDHVLWLDRGRVRGLGETETVLSSYETHVRLQDAAANSQDVPMASNLAAPHKGLDMSTSSSTGKKAGLLKAAVQGVVVNVDKQVPSPLEGNDLVITVQAIANGTEAPSIGIMLEQYRGVGITSLATHAEGVALTSIGAADGWTTWEVTLTFPDLPLHSGQYSLSFYLFDSQGLVVYDEWKDFILLQWLRASLTPGLVRLPHRWS